MQGGEKQSRYTVSKKHSRNIHEHESGEWFAIRRVGKGYLYAMNLLGSKLDLFLAPDGGELQ